MRNSLERPLRRANRRLALLSACSLASLAWICAPALAQEIPAPASASPQAQPTPAPTSSTAQDSQDRRQGDIVVVGNRAIVASLQDVPVERTYDEDSVDSYDVSTVGEVLDAIQSENGDDQPSVLVNGRPVTDPADIADLPAEAISRIEALPRGAAQRVGGEAGQRAYNVVLKRQVRSATVTGSRQVATEGDWSNTKGEAILTYIKGQDRINLTVRGASSGSLFESERDLVPSTDFVPYSPIGNIIPVSGDEVDPALSALAGQTVSVVALPAGNTDPTLADLVAGANRTNPSDQSFYRTLRGASRPYDISLSGNKVLTPWLSLSFNGRLNWVRSENWSGLASALFYIPTSNPFSPFTTPVYIALNDPSRPLKGISHNSGQSISTTFNATHGLWRATLTGNWNERERSYAYEYSGALAGGSDIVDQAINPLDGSLASQIPISLRMSHSKTGTKALTADAEGPILNLPAGPMRGRVELGGEWDALDAVDTSGSRTFRRHNYGAKVALLMPLTSKQFLSVLGDSELDLEIGQSRLVRYGTLDHHSFAFNWQPVRWLRFVANDQRDEQPTIPELLAAPVTITPNVPYFDPLSGQTVDVTIISGGGGNLQSQDFRTRKLSWTVRPLPKYGAHLDADYVLTDLRNQLGALPSPSSAIVAAFPERFQRDAAGTLVLVDQRSVNFARQRSEQLRFGAGFAVRLTQANAGPIERSAGTNVHRIPPLNLQVNASYTILLNSTLLIREGLPVVDLLEGGAIGVGGGQQRHAWDFNLALTKAGTGLRLGARNSGERYLVTGTTAAPELLTFHSVTTVNAKLFAKLDQLFPKSNFAKGTRVSINIDNVFAKRQRVQDLLGNVPDAYQPARLDPVGRTVMFELRKVF